MGDERGYGRSITGVIAAPGGDDIVYTVAVNREGVILRPANSTNSESPPTDPPRTDGLVAISVAENSSPQALQITWSDLTIDWQLDGDQPSDTIVLTAPQLDSSPQQADIPTLANPPQQAVPSHRLGTHKQLVISEGPSLLTRLERYADEQRRARVEALWQEQSARRTHSPSTYVGMLAALLVTFLVIWHGLTYVEHFIVDTFVPISFEETLGSMPRTQFSAEMRPASERVSTAINKIGMRLVAALPQEQQALFKDHIVFQTYHQRVPNAFALPGGHVIVLTGLVSLADSPDQVAAVLAHELSHVTNRDGMKRLVSQIKWSLLVAYLSGELGSDGRFIMDQAEQLTTLRYSRSQETRADREGLLLMIRAGFKPQAAVDFFAALARRQNDDFGALGFLSTHPPSKVRSERLRKIYESMGIGDQSTFTASKELGLETEWTAIRNAALEAP